MKLPYTVIGMEGYNHMAPLTWGAAACLHVETKRVHNLATGQSCSREEWVELTRRGSAGGVPNVDLVLDGETDRPLVLVMSSDLPSFEIIQPRTGDGFWGCMMEGTKHYYVFRHPDDFQAYILTLKDRLDEWLGDGKRELHILDRVANDLLTLDSTSPSFQGFLLAVRRKMDFQIAEGSLRGDDDEEILWRAMTAWDRILERGWRPPA